MNALGIIAGLFAAALGSYAFLDFAHVASVKSSSFKRARELANGRGIINVGAGPRRSFYADVISYSPEVVSNVDFVPNGVPHFLELDIEREPLPFADKQFGCAFASHVLEHVDNWEYALGEMARVADYVLVVLPDPTYFSGWIWPDHRQHFLIEDMRYITLLHPNVEVYY